MFKKKKEQRPTTPIDYPDGLAVEDEDHKVWYIRNGKKYRVFSLRVLESWNFNPVKGSSASLSHIKRAGILGFRDGTFLQDFGTGLYYLISNNKKRRVTSPDVVKRFGLAAPIVVSSEEINLHEDGEDLR